MVLRDFDKENHRRDLTAAHLMEVSLVFVQVTEEVFARCTCATLSFGTAVRACSLTGSMKRSRFDVGETRC